MVETRHKDLDLMKKRVETLYEYMQNQADAVRDEQLRLDQIQSDMSDLDEEIQELEKELLLPVKGSYVRLSNSEDGDDCGVSGICNECYEAGKTLAGYDYEPWEDDLNGDISTCHVCKVDIK